MNSVQSSEPRCDECGCLGKKIHRLHKGRRFCSTCYARLFKRRICAGCGNYARIHIDEKNERCRQCIAKAPCVRCARTGRPVGMITEYGPACSSCAHYFTVAEPCEQCATPSTRLSTVLRGEKRLRCCPRCAREDAATCPDCRRHRFLVLGEDGRMRCKLCSTLGKTHCVTCSQEMPAGKGKECDECCWKRHFEQRAYVYRERFEHGSVRERFTEFCDWLKAHMDIHKAALKLKSYIPFFLYLDGQPDGIPSYVALLEHFQADGLRRMQTPMLWLKERYDVQADEALREEHSDKRRIAELIASVPSGTGAGALAGYCAYLMSKHQVGGTNIRSIRLALRAAKSVLQEQSTTFDALPTQQSVRAYLTHTPGQKAAAQGFISYLNRTYDLSLKSEVNARAASRVRTQQLETNLRTLYAIRGEGDAFHRQWIKSALMLLHGLSSVNKKALSFSSWEIHGQAGFNVVLNKQTYWVPAPQAPLRWLNEIT